MITRKERFPHGFLSFSASVLGVLPQKGNLSANDNWDTLAAGIYASNGNVPSGSGLYAWGTLIVFGQDSPSLFGVAQMYFPNSNDGTFSWRTKYTYTGSYTSWQTLPSFLLSYSDLSSLASALGGFGTVTKINSSTDLNDITGFHVYYFGNESGDTLPSNLPEQTPGTFVSLGDGTLYARIQFYCINKWAGSRYYIRSYWGEWGEWKQLSFVQ